MTEEREIPTTCTRQGCDNDLPVGFVKRLREGSTSWKLKFCSRWCQEEWMCS